MSSGQASQAGTGQAWEGVGWQRKQSCRQLEWLCIYRYVMQVSSAAEIGCPVGGGI